MVMNRPEIKQFLRCLGSSMRTRLGLHRYLRGWTSRTRPEAYLIPRTWVSVAERLHVLGLDVDTLNYEYRGPVEAYNITSSSLATDMTEGHVLNTVTTKAMVKNVHLPAGSFLVSTRQKNAALAFATLEPENVDSYVSFSGIIPLNTGDEYPIFRIMAES